MCKNNRGNYSCPNPDCKHHSNPEQGFFIKKGYYITKHNSKKVPRYQCKRCGTKFSSHTFSDTKYQHKPELNKLVFEFYDRNVSQKGLASALHVNKKTIVRKKKFLAYKARKIHENELNNKGFQCYQIQFDEMETFEQTRMKPVTIAIAVECYWDDKAKKYRTGRIIDAIAAPMYYKSRNARAARQKYGEREDMSLGARVDVVESIKKAAAKPNIRVLTDGKTSYGTLFTDIMPACRHQVITRKMNSGTDIDRMFSLNHTCARLRHGMSRMARQSWVTTKSVDGLQEHLDLFIAFYNGYDLC